MEKDSFDLKTGITTGTCAAAATAAAMHLCLTGETYSEAKVSLPSGGFLFVPVYKEDEKTFYCIKDAGDDPDVTNGAMVKATVVPAEIVSSEKECKNNIDRTPGCVLNLENNEIISSDHKLTGKKFFSNSDYDGLYLTSGPGVGIVTKPGLEQEIGYPAINKVPREMIFDAASRELLDLSKNRNSISSQNSSMGEHSSSDHAYSHESQKQIQNFLIIISVENGEEIAKKTFNSRLGIEGGISILGTTGIVEPMSERALVKSIEAEMKVVLAEGDGNLFAAPGNYGEKYIKENHITDSHIILCSNYIGDTIDLAVHLNAVSLTIVGNCGKLCKLAAGIMNTHSRVADGRFEVFAANAALSGAPENCIYELKQAITTDEMLLILTKYGLREKVVEKMMAAIQSHVTYRAGVLPTHVIMHSEKYGLLGMY